MASFAVDLWESVFTPGPTPAVLRAANASFAALQLVLAALLAATASPHFAALSVLCAGLWWSVNWFAAELAVAQQQQQRQQLRDDDKRQGVQKSRRRRRRRRCHQGEDDDDDDADEANEASSDTEIEAHAARRVVSASAAVAAAAAAASELRQRAGVTHASPASTRSSASTEDEWEKVSGSERDKAS